MKYDEPKENEWIKPVRKGYKFCCCDCGVVHELDFRYTDTPVGKQIWFRARRNNRSTGQVRRKMIRDGKMSLKRIGGKDDR